MNESNDEMRFVKDVLTAVRRRREAGACRPPGDEYAHRVVAEQAFRTSSHGPLRPHRTNPTIRLLPLDPKLPGSQTNGQVAIRRVFRLADTDTGQGAGLLSSPLLAVPERSAFKSPKALPTSSNDRHPS